MLCGDGLVRGFVGGRGGLAADRGRIVVHEGRGDRAGARLVVVEDFRQAGALLDAICTGIKVKLLDLLQRLMVIVEVLGGRGGVSTAVTTVVLAIVIAVAGAAFGRDCCGCRDFGHRCHVRDHDPARARSLRHANIFPIIRTTATATTNLISIATPCYHLVHNVHFRIVYQLANLFVALLDHVLE